MAATVAVVAFVVGAGSQIYSAHESAKDRDDARDRLKKQAKRDAEIHSEESKALRSKQIALYAASGVRVDDGSPLAVIEESQRRAEEERESILEGFGYREDALSDEASRIRVSGYSGAAGTLLGGAATYATSPYAKNPFASSAPTDPGTYYKG